MMDAVDCALADARRRNRRASYLAWILALVLLLTLAGVLSAAGVLPTIQVGQSAGDASHDESVGDRATPASDGSTQSWDATAQAAWDGPATHLDWSGRGYSTSESSFIGDRIATPGDSTRRTLLLTNDGPARAGLVVSLRLGQLVTGDARNPALAEDVELFWNVGGIEGRQLYSDLLDESTGIVDIAEVQVAEGEAVAVEIGFELPASTSAQRNEGQPSTELAFDVIATMSGDADAQPNRLATTGAGSLIPFGIAAALLMLLGLLLVARRRRRCDDCSRTISRDESWVELEDRGHARYRVCPDCALHRTTAAGDPHH